MKRLCFLLLCLALISCGLVDKLEQASASSSAQASASSVEVPVASSAPVEVPSAAVAPIPTILGRYQTSFESTGTHQDRAHNIQLVAGLLTNKEIQPGAEFSFNKTIGPRTEARGFKVAPTIFAGEIRKDLGGGTCQVSSTLFAAALQAQMEIVSRQPHSRASTYIPTGLDATVSYPPECNPDNPKDLSCLDLRIKNPFPYTVTVYVTIESLEALTVLTVELRGVAPPRPTIDWLWVTYRTPSFEKVIQVRPDFLKDKKHLKQPGANGLEGALLVKETQPSGQLYSFRIPSNYKPVQEIWEVGPDWDTSKNPWD